LDWYLEGLEFSKGDINLMDQINVNDVASVYSGKSHTCYCGCAGTHTYNPAHVEWAGKNRGYAIESTEVNLKTVKRIVNKLNKSFSELSVIDDKIFTLTVGNHDYTVYMRDYSEEKRALALKESDRAAASALIVKEFNELHPMSAVYLKLVDESTSAAFAVHFRFNDPWVDSSIYDRGNAIIYPSEAVFEQIQKLAGDIEVNWNNTRSIGWLNL
jgi:hypothetical protein